MNIKIVGPGCKNCRSLYEITKNVANDVSDTIVVEHIDDIAEMISLGVSKSPGIIINDKIVSQGKKLKEKEVIALINSYL